MLIASSVVHDFEKADGQVTLDENSRHRRRLKLVTDQIGAGSSIEFLLNLPKARLLRHGDGLVLDDGRIIEVLAAPEPLLEVRGQDERHLITLAWQIGNRHLAAQILEDRILIRQDNVIAAMLEGLGATIKEVVAPFDPEGGAYDGGHGSHGHAHSHD
ncbi:MAG: urease accessory protein UreE [Pseudomonadota bacterium]